MKNKFSKHWKASTQPRKQRKYVANAPLHIKRKLLSVNLSKELRNKHKVRNIEVRKGDTVKIMRGKFKKKTGKIIEVNVKISKVKVEGIQVKKQDGSKAYIKMRPSNLQIIELNLDDKKRTLGNKKMKTTNKETKKEESTKKTEEKK
jgi:large subunit ribosomal protein L24